LTISQEEKIPSPQPRNSWLAAKAKQRISDKDIQPFHEKKKSLLHVFLIRIFVHFTRRKICFLHSQEIAS